MLVQILQMLKDQNLRFNKIESNIKIWFLSSYLILSVALGPGVYSASNRNEYQKYKNNVSGE
jgi:hypothetical protein